jgi:hypothetical protein
MVALVDWNPHPIADLARAYADVLGPTSGPGMALESNPRSGESIVCVCNKVACWQTLICPWFF